MSWIFASIFGLSPEERRNTFAKGYTNYLGHRIATYLLVVIFFMKISIGVVSVISEIDETVFCGVVAVVVVVAIAWIKSRKMWILLIIIANVSLIRLAKQTFTVASQILEEDYFDAIYTFMIDIVGVVSRQTQATIRFAYGEQNNVETFCLVSAWSLVVAKFVSYDVVKYIMTNISIVMTDEPTWNIVTFDAKVLFGTIMACFSIAIGIIGIYDSVIKSIIIVLGLSTVAIGVSSEVIFLYNFDYSITASIAVYQNLVEYTNIPRGFRFMCKNKSNALDALGAGIIVWTPVQTVVGCIARALGYTNTIKRKHVVKVAGAVVLTTVIGMIGYKLINKSDDESSDEKVEK